VQFSVAIEVCGVRIATTLENLEANLKGLHAPTEKELRKRDVEHKAQQENEESRPKATRRGTPKEQAEKESTATTKQVKETGGRGKMEDICVCIAAEASTSPW
jgi:hypothetical protein